MRHKDSDDLLQKLISSWENSPFPSLKISSYFDSYVQLFGHLVGSHCTFIETGILDGGSLFMWRDWLGPNARIIGIDLNPEANKWVNHGFEIHIGDQGDPSFWRKTLEKIGEFDALLDDGGHQSFQQIVTAYEAIQASRKSCVIAIEDTATSFMHDFSHHGNHSFLEYAKSSTDVLIGKMLDIYPNRVRTMANTRVIDAFSKVSSVEFFTGIVAFKVTSEPAQKSRLIRNRTADGATDFRYEGASSAIVDWPNPFAEEIIELKGRS